MRITNDMRSFIVNEAINKTLERRKKALKAESNELAILTYDRLYPPDVQAKMEQLPAEFFHQESTIYIQPSDSCRKSEYIRLQLLSSRKVSALDRDWKRPCWNIKGVENAVTKRIHAHVKKREKLEFDESNLRQGLQTMLKNIHTLKQLREEWPDGETYYQAFVPAPPVKNLPAVRGKDITEIILELGEIE